MLIIEIKYFCMMESFNVNQQIKQTVQFTYNFKRLTIQL